MKLFTKYIFLSIFLIVSSNIYALSADENTFFNSIDKGDKKTVKTLLDQGINVNITDNKGWSALHRAVFANNIEIVKILLENSNIKVECTLPIGTYLYTPNGTPWYAYGQTPLHLASFKGYSEIAELLLDNGANILAKDNANDSTPIHIAVAQKNAKTVMALLDSKQAKNSKINILEIKDKTGNTALISATIYNRTDIMSELMMYNPNIDAIDKVNRTALHYAIDNDNYDATAILLKAGASVDSRDIYGTTPYELIKGANIRGLLNFHMRNETKKNVFVSKK